MTSIPTDQDHVTRPSHSGPAARIIERIPPALLPLAALAAACGGEPAEAPPAEERGTGVDAAVAQQDTVSLDVRAVGSLEADARVRIRPEIDGHVTSVEFREGAEVEAGEVLVRLDQNKLKARVQAARATVQSARAEVQNLDRRLGRNDTLLAQGAISQQAYDDLRTQLNTARARLEEARANLELAEQELADATIRAPFSGRTGARSFDVGDYVRVGDDLFTLVDDDPMEIGFSVPESYLGSLHRGSPVELTVRSMPGRTFRGRVDFVSPYVDVSNRTVALKARVPNPESELRAGQFADVRLQLESRPAVLVPEASVVPQQGGNLVFLARGGRAARTPVEVGARRRGVVEILSGVAAGDTVVVAGQQKIEDGTRLAVTLSGGELRGAGLGGPEPSGGSDAAGPPASGGDGRASRGEGEGEGSDADAASSTGSDAAAGRGGG